MTIHTIELKPRMKHPVAIFPEAMRALGALGKVTRTSSIPSRTLMLVELRASQINGCSFCVDMHSRDLKRDGESDERIFGVAAWYDNPVYAPAERAALALTEALTRVSDRPDSVSDEVWDEAAAHYDQTALAALVIAIANINVWNRLNVAVRQVVGEWPG
jgi:AhpD family alkylhydroperoxidase